MAPKALAARTRPRARPGPLRSACRPRDRASALAHSRQFPTFHHQDRDAVSWGEASAVDSITDDMLETALECNAEWRSDGDGQWSVAEPTPSAAGAAGAALLEERREQQAQGVTRERELTFPCTKFPARRGGRTQPKGAQEALTMPHSPPPLCVRRRSTRSSPEQARC